MVARSLEPEGDPSRRGFDPAFSCHRPRIAPLPFRAQGVDDGQVPMMLDELLQSVARQRGGVPQELTPYQT
jgi:hypothetical protein